MRKNYIEPVDRYHNRSLSKLRSNCNKLAYLKKDNNNLTILCSDSDSNKNTLKNNDGNSYKDIW